MNIYAYLWDVQDQLEYVKHKEERESFTTLNKMNINQYADEWSPVTGLYLEGLLAYISPFIL